MYQVKVVKEGGNSRIYITDGVDVREIFPIPPNSYDFERMFEDAQKYAQRLNYPWRYR
jgi:hypothetical protein